MDVGRGEMGDGSWKLEVGRRKMENGRGELEVGRWKLAVEKIVQILVIILQTLFLVDALF